MTVQVTWPYTMMIHENGTYFPLNPNKHDAVLIVMLTMMIKICVTAFWYFNVTTMASNVTLTL